MASDKKTEWLNGLIERGEEVDQSSTIEGRSLKEKKRLQKEMRG